MNMHAKTLLAAALLSLSCFAAQAEQETPGAAAPGADRQEVRPAKAEVNCLRYTGSLVMAAQARRDERAARKSGSVAAKPPCNGSAGQSYSREDIQGTGAVDLVDALRRLDTSIR